MGAYDRALEDIKKIGRTFQGIIDMAAQLEGINSLDQVTNEASIRCDAAKKAAADAEAKLASLQQAVAQADNDAVTVLSNANSSAQAILAKAKADADKVIADATQQAAALVDGAKKVKADVDAITAQLQKQAADVTADLEVKRAELQAINDAKAALAKKLG